MFDTTRRPLPPPTPALEKERKHRADAQIIGPFVEWLMERTEDVPAGMRIPQVLHEYFGIDAEKCEQERRELLAYCRVMNLLADEAKELGIELK